jgi:hypothetical protein
LRKKIKKTKENTEDDIQQNPISACYLGPERAIFMLLHVFVEVCLDTGTLYDLVHNTVLKALKGIHHAQNLLRWS